MVETALAERARIWTPSGFVDDEWTLADTLEEAGDAGSVILPLAAFRELSDADREARGKRLGVLIGPDDEDWQSIGNQFGSVGLIALAFPAYTDGRSYSKASLLRDRLRYTGPLRAVGDILYDQVDHMLRVGFDQLAIVNGPTIERLEDRRMPGIGLAYQPATRQAAGAEGFSWRRNLKG